MSGRGRWRRSAPAVRSSTARGLLHCTTVRSGCDLRFDSSSVGKMGFQGQAARGSAAFLAPWSQGHAADKKHFRPIRR